MPASSPTVAVLLKATYKPAGWHTQEYVRKEGTKARDILRLWILIGLRPTDWVRRAGTSGFLFTVLCNSSSSSSHSSGGNSKKVLLFYYMWSLSSKITLSSPLSFHLLPFASLCDRISSSCSSADSFGLFLTRIWFHGPKEDVDAEVEKWEKKANYSNHIKRVLFRENTPKLLPVCAL